MASKPHLEALAQPDSPVRVTGIFNRGRARSEQVSARYGYRIFDSLEAIAGDPQTEGAILLTPPDNRLGIVTTLAKAGKHILMEKPVERTMDIVFCALGIVLLVPGIVVLRKANAAACNEPLPETNCREWRCRQPRH
jgi:hypothetical protein